MTLYTSKVIAQWLCLTERRVRQLRDEGVIVEARPGLYELQPTVARYIKYLGGAGKESLNTERMKLTAEKRKAAEMDNDLRRGDLHSTQDIEKGIQTMCLNIRSRFLAMPAKLKQDTGSGTAAPWAPPTFKDCVAADICAAFFEENEHADRHTVDGKDVLIVLEDDDLREHSAHWEAGAKQNFDTGLYTAHTILYIRVEDYGPKPKIGKQLVLDKGTKSQRTYTINLCQEESGVYRMTMERTRQ